MFCEHCGHVLNSDHFCVNPNCPSNDEITYKKDPIQSYDDYADDNNNVSDDSSVYTQTYEDSDDHYDKNPYNMNLNASPTFEDFITFVGPKNTEYYVDRWHDYNHNENFIKWNWPAFFFGFYWLLYRKMWNCVCIFFLAEWGTNILLKNSPSYLSYVRTLIFMIVVGVLGNQLYVKSSISKISKIKLYLSGISAEQLKLRISSTGGTNLWLPILLLVLQIIVILLATFAIFAFLLPN